MSLMDKLVDQISSREEEAPVETPVETPEETTEETVTEQPGEKETTQEQEEESPNPAPDDTGTGEEEQPEEQPREKKDLSGIPKEEKAQYAFKRQLEKQRTKYEQQIQKMHDTFQKQFDEFKQSLKQPEPLKTRADFPIGDGGDDAYIDYLTEMKVNKILAERDSKAKAQEAEDEKARAEAAEADKAYQEQVTVFQDNCKQCFTDAATYANFAQKVNKGLENGLGELLDRAPAVRDYIFTNPNGPTVLDEMLSNRDSFVRIMKTAGNPMMATLELHDMANEIANRAKEPKEQKPAGMPHLGKPGSRGGTASRPLPTNDKDLINLVRKIH